ncbi:Myosin-1 [Frankliniella fusca]|uniref:Myosin-1 n=1 Tax=Frankliniella fusca TaxID=407009 RepID=A0AAE1I001_9NEOP|nr:Myosin-1 [Frankliniella fusca]
MTYLDMPTYAAPPTASIARPTSSEMDHAGMAVPPVTHEAVVTTIIVRPRDGLPAAQDLPPGVHVVDEQAQHHCGEEVDERPDVPPPPPPLDPSDEDTKAAATASPHVTRQLPSRPRV